MEKLKRKKQTRRSRDKFAALKPQYNLKIRADLIDYDYVEKLNEEEKEFLNKFTEEYTNASFKKESPKRKGKRRKLKNLHKTVKLRKSCNKINNDRNADIYSRAKAGNSLLNIEDVFRTEEELHDGLENMLQFSYQRPKTRKKR